MESGKHPHREESSPESARSNDPSDPGGHLTGDRTLLGLDEIEPASVRCPSCFASLPRQNRPERCPRCKLKLPGGGSLQLAVVAPAALALPDVEPPALAPRAPEPAAALAKPRHPYKCSGEGSCFHCDLTAHRQRVSQIEKASGRPRRKLPPGIQ